MDLQFIDYLVVSVLGALIGFVELLSRYKDAPFKVVFSPPGMFYLLLNGAASLIALWGIRLFDVSFIDNPNWTPEMIRWLQVGVAGVAAMTLFRSALFTFRTGDQDISVGPNAILQVLLVTVDKEVDRMRGAIRAKIVEDAMDGISFEEAVTNLPPVVIALMQNLSDKDKNEILDSVKIALESRAPERARVMTLGLNMINVVGEDILKAAIDMVNLDKKSKVDASQTPVDRPRDKAPRFDESRPATGTSTFPTAVSLDVEAAATPAEPAPESSELDPVVHKLAERLGKKAADPGKAADL